MGVVGDKSVGYLSQRTHNLLPISARDPNALRELAK